ncbi:MAG: alkaline phosphatase family protein [Chlorobi bacterium]|nr:alkaline phosphatase family protein [Chlorobiota bacterium]
MCSFVSILFLFLSVLSLQAQEHLLQSGPMLGYSEMREVFIWAQTTESARVKVFYREKGTEEPWIDSREILTVPEDAFVAHLVLDQVEPGKRYDYHLFINDQKVERPYPTEFQTQTLWQWRTDPPEFTIALGSCAYVNEEEYDRPGEPYGGDYQIFESIHKLRPNAMLWLGDNTYLREADWYSRSGILERHTHTRSLPELQPLLASTHHYAIWDDHDFGPNNSDRGFREKETTCEAFRLFWGNPTYGTEEVGGIFSMFQWEDIEFFLLDNRWHRSPNNRKTGPREMFGEAQLEALIDRLVNSRAPFKIIAMGGQALNPVERWETWATFQEEKARFMEMIAEENISGVFFLSGDRHHSELTKLEREGDYPLYDLTVSPLTANPANYPNEPNTLRVPDTYVGVRNFATLTFTGPRKERAMTMRIYDVAGNELWSQVVQASELKRKK